MPRGSRKIVGSLLFHSALWGHDNWCVAQDVLSNTSRIWQPQGTAVGGSDVSRSHSASVRCQSSHLGKVQYCTLKGVWLQSNTNNGVVVEKIMFDPRC